MQSHVAEFVPPIFPADLQAAASSRANHGSGTQDQELPPPLQQGRRGNRVLPHRLRPLIVLRIAMPAFRISTYSAGVSADATWPLKRKSPFLARVLLWRSLVGKPIFYENGAVEQGGKERIFGTEQWSFRNHPGVTPVN